MWTPFRRIRGFVRCTVHIGCDPVKEHLCLMYKSSDLGWSHDQRCCVRKGSDQLGWTTVFRLSKSVSFHRHVIERAVWTVWCGICEWVVNAMNIFWISKGKSKVMHYCIVSSTDSDFNKTRSQLTTQSRVAQSLRWRWKLEYFDSQYKQYLIERRYSLSGPYARLFI